MNMLKLLISIMLASLCLVANATEGKWASDYGQGNLEYFIDKEGARLHIGCPSELSNDGPDSRVSLVVKGKDVTSFKIIVSGSTYDGPFKTGARYSSNNFINLIDDLNKGDAKVIYGKTVVLFPKSNIKDVLHTYRSGKLGCAVN